MTIAIRAKRICDPPGAADEARVLVDRIWPRGVRKDAVVLPLWLNEIAPSKALRQWFGHAREHWDKFRQRYHEELDRNTEAVQRLHDLSRSGRLTLLFAAQDRERNNAMELAEYILARERDNWRIHGSVDHDD
jgi:uncharacterized protein YeaO (DUF488 family)